jgi:hypothetical protein
VDENLLSLYRDEEAFDKGAERNTLLSLPKLMTNIEGKIGSKDNYGLPLILVFGSTQGSNFSSSAVASSRVM